MMSRNSLRVVIAIVTVTAISVTSSPILAEELCADAERLLKVKSPNIETTELPEDMEKKIVMERVCVKSYPWPKGVFLTDEHDTDRAITADEMERLANSISKALETGEYSNLDPESKENLQIHVNVGANHDQIKRYGAFLHLKKLYDEERYGDLIKSADNYINSFDIKASQTGWDSMEDHTYFTKESLANFIFLYKYKAKSKIIDGINASNLSDLIEFAKIKNSLSAQINFLKNLDPTEDLRINVGCFQEPEENG